MDGESGPTFSDLAGQRQSKQTLSCDPCGPDSAVGCSLRFPVPSTTASLKLGLTVSGATLAF